MDAHAIGQDERDEAGEQAIDEQSPLVFLHALHVHLQGGKEHNVIKSHLAEQLKRRIPLQDIESILADEHASQYHSDDMGNTEFAHNDRGEEDDEQHYEEDQRRVGYREILGDVPHRLYTLVMIATAKVRIIIG